jgi:hypothetical protein
LEKPTYPVATGIIGVVDRHRFDANTNPDPTFHFDAYTDPDPTFYFDAKPDPNPTPRLTHVGKSEFFFTVIHNHSNASLLCFMFFVSVIDS